MLLQARQSSDLNSANLDRKSKKFPNSTTIPIIKVNLELKLRPWKEPTVRNENLKKGCPELNLDAPRVLSIIDSIRYHQFGSKHDPFHNPIIIHDE